MGVDVGGGGDVGVAEPVLNLLEREALLEQQGCDRVAQIMEADARQGGSAADALELARDIIRADMLFERIAVAVPSCFRAPAFSSASASCP